MVISPNQKKLLEFLKLCATRFDSSPTRREIKDHFGWASLSSVNYHLNKLSKAGLIELAPYVERGIRIIEEPEGSLLGGLISIPLLGTVSAGQPVEAFSDIAEQIAVPSSMINQKHNNYGLRVRGDSMIDEHICDGDLLVVRAQIIAKNGDTVIALVDGFSTTVKKIFFEPGGKVRLQPANRSFSPIIIAPPQTLEVQGILVGVIRYK